MNFRANKVSLLKKKVKNKTYLCYATFMPNHYALLLYVFNKQLIQTKRVSSICFGR